MIQKVRTIQSFLNLDYLRQIQDAFSAAFNLSVMLVKRDGSPLDKPGSRQPVWRRETGSEHRNDGCRDSIQALLRACAEKKAPVHSSCPDTGYAVAAIPILLDDQLLGGWILGEVKIDDEPGLSATEANRLLAEPAVDRAPSRPRAFSREGFDSVVDLLATVNRVVVRMAKKNRDMSFRNHTLQGISDRADDSNAMLRKFIDSSHVATYISDCHTGELPMVNRAYRRTSTRLKILEGKAWDDGDGARFLDQLRIATRAAAIGERAASLVYIRVENYDLLAGAYDRECAEKLVEQICSSIMASVRAGDSTTRFTKDEIMLVFPGCPKAMAKARMIQARNHFLQTREDQSTTPFTFSVFEIEEDFNLDAFLKFVRNETDVDDMFELAGQEDTDTR